jgi:hypothetical protein
MFADLIGKVIDDYKIDPKNKIIIDENTLWASSLEETGNPVSRDQLRAAIKNFLSNDMDGDDYSIYDGAIYACSVVANRCFGDPVEYENDDYFSVDHEINWISNNDGSFCAVVRPI